LEEEKNINNTIAEIQKEIDNIQREVEEQKRQFRLAKEERQQEQKRMTDLQGEVTAMRKRLDEQRGRLDVNKADLQKLTTRVEDLERIRRELRKEQDEFIEQQTLVATDREKKWKNWQTQFAEIEKRADEVAEQVKSLDTTHRDVKRMKREIESLAEQVERRINEITEMQRLAEERFRQEWTTFKADDQKRWTNYTLTQNEYRSEIERQNRELGERLTILEDGTQEMQDQIRQLSGQFEKQLQTLLALIREWVSNYEEIMDGIR
jgi:chromosome segregation ATPase